jgi:CHASE2 domain-containing sensor protein
MARRKITNTQAVCIILLWGILCYILLAYSGTIDFYTAFVIIASAVIVFVPLYKNRKRAANDRGRK